MKSFSILSALAALVLSPALQASEMISYDFNTSFWNPIVPSYNADKVNIGILKGLGLTMDHATSGAEDGSAYNSFGGWDYTKDFSFARTDLMRSIDAISFDFCVSEPTCGTVTGVSFDVMLPFNDSVDISASSFQAAIFWEDANGDVQFGKSATFVLSGDAAWSTLNLNFITWSAALPQDMSDSGRYLVEIYAFGGQGNNTVYVDNIALQGNVGAVCVPEPGSAVLVLVAGMFALGFRRRK